MTNKRKVQDIGNKISYLVSGIRVDLKHRIDKEAIEAKKESEKTGNDRATSSTNSNKMTNSGSDHGKAEKGSKSRLTKTDNRYYVFNNESAPPLFKQRFDEQLQTFATHFFLTLLF